ncbi:uncharacterized protein LOC130828448 [Amaranthus tricolor]|uniref:uncharacterized protein LOC130828448 n=1 Tax=Amaranthus tricolor TaxID=29722 RepID=UPI0025840C33|nr:uncharacterized protein LOC130828448 [Amaranthus tricolor]
MWAIWFMRNKVIFEDCPNKIVDAVFSFTTMVREYKAYACKVFDLRDQSTSLASQWSPPESNWIKINVDAHMANGTDKGLGAVCRDNHGNLILVGVRGVQATWSTAVSELTVAGFGVELAIRLGFSHIHLEGDNVVVFKEITNSSSGFSPFYVLLDQIRSLLSSFRGVRRSVVRRSGNTAAHMVARWNLGSFGDTIYMHYFPQSLISLVTLDLI